MHPQPTTASDSTSSTTCYSLSPGRLRTREQQPRSSHNFSTVHHHLSTRTPGQGATIAPAQSSGAQSRHPHARHQHFLIHPSFAHLISAYLAGVHLFTSYHTPPSCPLPHFAHIVKHCQANAPRSTPPPFLQPQRTARPSQAFRPGTDQQPPPAACRPAQPLNRPSFSLTYSRATLALLSTRYSRPPCVNTSCHTDPPFALACSTHGTRHLLIFRVPTARTATTSTTAPRSGSSNSLTARYGGCASFLAVFLNTTRPKLLLRSSLTGAPLASSSLSTIDCASV